MTATVDAVGTELAVGRLMRVLSDSTRLAILRRLAQGDATVSELIASVGSPSQSRVSNHLACLRWCGLVTAEKFGRRMLYRLADRSVLPLIDIAGAVAAPHAERLVSCSRLGPECA
jgi:ArsR family transcriptional regulator, cadmium/lead-responsive transcriptional repressor